MVKQIFIPASAASQVIEVEVAAGVNAAPTVPGDWVAIAGIRAVNVLRTFEEADPLDPYQPLFIQTDDASVISSVALNSAGEIPAGSNITVTDIGFSVPVDRLTTLYEIVDPADPTVVLASYSGDAWNNAPDVSAGGGRRKLNITMSYKDRYSERTRTSGLTVDYYSVSGSPLFSAAPSIAGTATAGQTATITPAVPTGEPTPTRTFQLYVDGVASGSPFSGLTFVMSTASTKYKVAQIAENVNGTVTSDFSNEITTASVTIPGPAWTEAWADMTELQTGTPGRLQVTISAAVTINPAYDYFVYTSASTTPNVTDVRTNGGAFTGATVSVRNPKEVGTVIRPRIVAVDKLVTTDGVGGLFVLSTLGWPSGYTITGILSDTSIRGLDFPIPDPTVVAWCKAKWNGLGSSKIQCQFDPGWTHVNRAYDAHMLIPIAMAAYYGDTSCQTIIVTQLQMWRNNTYANSDIAAWTGNDPVFDGCYSANYGSTWLTVMIAALMTPAIRTSIGDIGIRACGAFIESAYAVEIYLQTPVSTGSDSRNSMLGKSGSCLLGAEPNISVNNLMILIMCDKFFQTQTGKEYLTLRGFASLDAWWTNFSKENFYNYLDSNVMRVGGVAGGKRVCDTLYRMWAQTSPLNVSKFDNSTPTNSTIRATACMGGGRTAWRMQYGPHSLDNLELIFCNALNRACGLDPGDITNLGTSRTGMNGALLDMANPNKTTDPPTGRGGPRCAKWGIRWYWGFAAGATINPVASRGTWDKLNFNGTGTRPDFKKGVPRYSPSGGWNISGGAFGDRRGCAINTTYQPCPFEGVEGIYSEGDSVDEGSYHYETATTYKPGGERSTSSYMAFTMRAMFLAFYGGALTQQGPLNLMSTSRAMMTSNWASSDAGFTTAAAPNSDYGSTNCYSYPYSVGQSGTSGELLCNNIPVTAGAIYAPMIRMNAVSGTGKVDVKVRFFNASAVQVGTDIVLYSGALSTTMVDKDVQALAPAGAVAMSFVITVDKSLSTGPIIFGGPCVRHAPNPLCDWDAAHVKASTERFRRATINFRFMMVNGWRDIAKMAMDYPGTSSVESSDSSNRDWASDAEGSRAYYIALAPLINDVIPWIRKVTNGFPAINSEFTNWNWEAPVTTVASSGLTVKT